MQASLVVQNELNLLLSHLNLLQKQMKLLQTYIALLAERPKPSALVPASPAEAIETSAEMISSACRRG
jgi:hypothetical protein